MKNGFSARNITQTMTKFWWGNELVVCLKIIKKLKVLEGRINMRHISS